MYDVIKTNEKTELQTVYEKQAFFKNVMQGNTTYISEHLRLG